MVPPAPLQTCMRCEISYTERTAYRATYERLPQEIAGAGSIPSSLRQSSSILEFKPNVRKAESMVRETRVASWMFNSPSFPRRF